jgi:hypothetical protein
MSEDKKSRHSVIPVSVVIKNELNELREKLGSKLQGPLSYNALMRYLLDKVK